MKRTLFILPIFLLFSSFTGGGLRTIKDLIDENIDFLESFYKRMHRNPEISLREKETSKILAEELQSLGFEVTENFGGYGIVGIFKNGEGLQILYRTDMDALPMTEKTGLPYKSEKTIDYNDAVVGTMHSCGHDLHMTTWLGTARAMVKMKDRWKGTLMLIGQPAEEIGSGSKMMLEKGLYETFNVPDYGIALHSSPTIASGKVGISDGYTMANTESIDIKLFGYGAHGAAPHMSVDPIVLAGMTIMELQTIVSRNVNPIDGAVVTVGAIKGGTKHNIIPDEVLLQLTVRTYTEEVRQLVHRRIREIVKGIAISAGLPEDKMPEVTIPDAFIPANYNDPKLVEKFKQSAKEAIGDRNVIFEEPLMLGEDFSRFGRTEENVPTILFWLGTVPEERFKQSKLPGLHSPFYYPEVRASIKTGVAVTTTTLVNLFNE